MTSYSGNDRGRIRHALKQPLDVLIVGGGINGAGLARDLALRGARVGVVEKDDFAHGTSSRSSRLIHGGLRYLEQRQIGLVFESVTERWRMSHLARHLVRPLPFVFPVYEGSRVPLWMVRLGVTLYDALALFRNYENHRGLSKEEVAHLLPSFDQSKLTGALLYYDYRTNDARMTLENVIAASEAGAAILSRAKAIAPIVERSDRGRVIAGAMIHDELTGERFEARARIVVSATGPWTDEALRILGVEKPGEHPHLRPTKGVHIVVPREKLPLRAAAAMTHPRDGRVLFALPYEERAVIGTTDTDWQGSPDSVRVESSDVDYLLEVAASLFPSSKLTRADVISSWAGLRPLMNADAVKASSVPREHRILTTPEGLIAIFGGKLTTYRKMCEELADHVAMELAKRGGPDLGGSTTEALPLPGAETLDTDEDLQRVIEQAEQQGGFDRVCATHLAETYGSRAIGILDRVARDTSGLLRRRVISDLPFVWAEVEWAAEREMALSVEDVFVRRTGIFYRDVDNGLGAAPQAVTLLGDVLGWSPARRDEELERYRAFVLASRAWQGNAPAVTSLAS